jgi:hypothetical protein
MWLLLLQGLQKGCRHRQAALSAVLPVATAGGKNHLASTAAATITATIVL